MLQRAPFQCSISAWFCGAYSRWPTAHASSGARAATDHSLTLPFLGRGTLRHARPFQRHATLPIIQATLPEAAETACGDAVGAAGQEGFPGPQTMPPGSKGPAYGWEARNQPYG